MFPIPPFLLSATAIKAYCVLAGVAAIAIAGAIVVHSIRADAVKTLVAQDTAHAEQVNAAGAKIDAAQSAVDAKSAEDSATHQTAIASAAAVIKQKVSTHVHNPAPAAPRVVGCVTYGLVRLHDAAALGVDPDTLPLPSGVSDDACSPVADTDLAAAFADNYAAARANAAQLDDLIANVKGKVDSTTPKQ